MATKILDGFLMKDGGTGKLSTNATSGLSDNLTELYTAVNKQYTVNLIEQVSFFNAYYNNETPPKLVNSTNQLSSGFIRLPVGTTLKIKPSSGWRIYVRFYDENHAVQGGVGYFTTNAEVVTTYPLITFNIAKNPYSTSDTITPADAQNVRVEYERNSVTPYETYCAYKHDDISVTGNYLIGVQGVRLLPAGSYSITGIFKTSASYLTLNVYGDASSPFLTKQITPSDNEQTIFLNASAQIERFFFVVGAGNTLTVENFRVNKYQWGGYEYSNTSNWVPMPYNAENIDPVLSLADYVTANFRTSKWYGKKIIFNGDSITQGIYTEDHGGKTGYVREVCERLIPGTMKNYAIGGTRMARVSGVSDAMVDRLQDMDTTADLVFIMANTNDYASQVPIGDPDSTDPTTYNGALNTVFSFLAETFPQTPVVISTMLSRKENTDGQGVPLPITIEQYAQAVRDRVHAYKFVLFDAFYWSGLNLKTSPLDGTGVTNDGLHPNSKGAELLGERVANFLNNF